MALVNCSACGGKLSDEATACVHCGHPISRGSRTSYLFLVGVVGVIAGAVVFLGLLVYKVMLPPPQSSYTEATETPIARPTEKQRQVSKIPKDMLEKELRSYVIRINRLTPFKPNQSITLQRVLYDSRPQRLIYEYEMNVVAEDFDFYDVTFSERLRQRYCTSEELELASSNGVPVTWRYFKAGVRQHEVTLDSC